MFRLTHFQEVFRHRHGEAQPQDLHSLRPTVLPNHHLAQTAQGSHLGHAVGELACRDDSRPKQAFPTPDLTAIEQMEGLGQKQVSR
jgi:hypothetical protein